MTRATDKLNRLTRLVTFGLLPCALCVGAMPQDLAIDPVAAQTSIIIKQGDEDEDPPLPELPRLPPDDGIYSVIDDLEDVIQLQPSDQKEASARPQSAPKPPPAAPATLEDLKQINAALDDVLDGGSEAGLGDITELSTLTGFYRDRLSALDRAQLSEADRAYYDELKGLDTRLARLEGQSPKADSLQDLITREIGASLKSARYDFDAELAGYRAQISRLQSACPYNSYIRLAKEVNQLQQFIDFVVFEHGPDYVDAQTYGSARRNIANAQGMQRDLELLCEPEWALREIRAIAPKCDLPAMREYYEILKGISAYTDFELRHVRDNGTHGVLTQPLAKARYDAAQRALREADQMIKTCTPPDQVASADQPMPAMTPAAYQPDAPANPGRTQCDDSDADRLCRSWAPLLGAWTSPEFGGEIEFRLQGDNSVSAFISQVSERMRMQGYTKGMVIARGLRKPGGGGTWSFAAGGGEAFDAAQPGATGTLGQSKWTPNALFFIEAAKPGVLNLPATLEGNLSDYNEWVRPGTSASCPTTNTDCRTFEPVLGTWTNPTHGGIIEFRKDGTDTLAAYVISANPIMQEQGFTGGMAILRGLRLNPTGNTWSFAAGRGEVFSPKHPDREAGQTYGTPKWNENALVFIEMAQSNVINLPPELKARMGNYTDWVRAGTRTR